MRTFSLAGIVPFNHPPMLPGGYACAVEPAGSWADVPPCQKTIAVGQTLTDAIELGCDDGFGDLMKWFSFRLLAPMVLTITVTSPDPYLTDFALKAGAHAIAFDDDYLNFSSGPTPDDPDTPTLWTSTLTVTLTNLADYTIEVYPDDYTTEGPFTLSVSGVCLFQGDLAVTVDGLCAEVDFGGYAAQGYSDLAHTVPLTSDFAYFTGSYTGNAFSLAGLEAGYWVIDVYAGTPMDAATSCYGKTTERAHAQGNAQISSGGSATLSLAPTCSTGYIWTSEFQFVQQVATTDAVWRFEIYAAGTATLLGTGYTNDVDPTFVDFDCTGITPCPTPWPGINVDVYFEEDPSLAICDSGPGTPTFPRTAWIYHFFRFAVQRDGSMIPGDTSIPKFTGACFPRTVTLTLLGAISGLPVYDSAYDILVSILSFPLITAVGPLYPDVNGEVKFTVPAGTYDVYVGGVIATITVGGTDYTDTLTVPGL